MEKKIRFGIIGCGMISNFHAKALEEMENAELVAAFDTNKTSANSFAKKHECKAFYEVEQMLRPEIIDAVCICTPSGLHAPLTLMACKAKIHVLVEKPMALNVEDAMQIVETARECNVKVGVVSQLRFSEGIQQLKKCIEEGTLGKLIFGNITMHYYRNPDYYTSSDWRGTWRMDGGGALMNQGIHGMDILRYLMGDIKNVNGRIKTRVHKIEVEDTAVAIVEYENGALGTVSASTCCKLGQPRIIEVCGEKGRVVLEEDKIALWEIEGSCKPESSDRGLNNKTADDPSALDFRGHYMQLQDFVEAILTNKEPLSNAWEGMKTVEFIRGIYESAFRYF